MYDTYVYTRYECMHRNPVYGIGQPCTCMVPNNRPYFERSIFITLLLSGGLTTSLWPRVARNRLNIGKAANQIPRQVLC